MNACSTDLDAFRDRGGKLIVLCGWEDQTTPSPETVAWYEMLAERNGGYAKTGEFCRLFALPGHAHGGGKGRIGTGGGYTFEHLALLRKWVEEGKAPETYPQLWREMKLTLPPMSSTPSSIAMTPLPGRMLNPVTSSASMLFSAA